MATPPASPATGIGMPVRGVALGVLVRARSHPQGVPQTARCHPAGGAVQDSPSAEQDRAAGSLRGAWGLVARPSALWLPKSPSRPPLGAAGGPCLCRRHTRRLSPPRLRLTKIEWPSGARRRWACPNGCSQPPLRADSRVCHLLGYTPRRLSPPRLLVRKYECPSSCNADWHGQSDESLVPLRLVVLRSTGVIADAVPPGVLRPMYTATRDAAASRNGRRDAARESSESAWV